MSCPTSEGPGPSSSPPSRCLEGRNNCWGAEDRVEATLQGVERWEKQPGSLTVMGWLLETWFASTRTTLLETQKCLFDYFEHCYSS